MSGIAELLPAAEGDADGPASGTVFKIERGPAGERIAYVRMFSGALRVRDRLQVGEDERKVTALSVFDRGSAVRARFDGRAPDRQGLGPRRDQDRRRDRRATRARGAPLRSADAGDGRRARQPGEKGALHVALTQLAEQDPLINLRQDDVRQELFLSLYGEVQKEVIQETLATDFGIDVEFRETTTICVERLVGTGAAVELIGERPNPFRATVGLRVEPGAGRLGRDVPARGGARVAAARVLPCGRGHGARDAAPGPLRLAGPGLRGHDDALRLLVSDVDGRGLPVADAARADERAAGGRHRRLRADPPLLARRADGHGRAGAVRAGAAGRRPAGAEPSAARRARSRATSRRLGCTSSGSSCRG